MIAKAQEEFGMEFTVGTEVENQVLESPGSTEVLKWSRRKGWGATYGSSAVVRAVSFFNSE